ncbi:ferredoxin FdxA [Derxia lacustris]|uniref:ferredoxin FdxA n=1 Tax=Derxia lacustris TaxID=764842 RepID=UPI000A16E6E9|nr:ferredoxin FdxA [Derxia lacustris]
MPFVVTEACIRCRHTDCAAVCPVECFRAGPDFLAIHPDECIDCAVCVPECPVGAIHADTALPPGQEAFAAINARLARHAGWPVITVREPAPPDHAHWATVAHKRALLAPALAATPEAG